jgi:choline kinase
VKTVVIAAGMGSRLGPLTQALPKTLLPFGHGTILSEILANFAAAGSDGFVLVIGFEGRRVRQALDGTDLDVRFVENPEWRRGNGISVLRAREVVGEEPFLLSMSDHLVAPAAVRRVIDAASAANLLLVDPRIERVFDLDDATKVRREGDRIAAIGKDLTDYDALDCGVFRLDGRFFAAMKEALAKGKESISDGARNLIAADAFEGVECPSDGEWIDVDTPEAYHYASQHPERFVWTAGRMP